MSGNFLGLAGRAGAAVTPAAPKSDEEIRAAIAAWSARQEVDPEPTAEQGAALQAYIDAREAVEGLRDDIYFSNSFAEKDEASAKLGPARAVYAQATREAERLGVLETGRRMFR